MQTLSNFKHKPNSESINQALKLLHREKLITDKDIRRMEEVGVTVSQRFNDVVGNISKATVESLNQAKDRVVTATRDTASRVDETAHKKPWMVVGISSALTGLAGFLIGMRLKR